MKFCMDDETKLIQLGLAQGASQRKRCLHIKLHWIPKAMLRSSSRKICLQLNYVMSNYIHIHEYPKKYYAVVLI